jgi:hypothetical protein
MKGFNGFAARISSCFRVLEHFKISNSKHQITNKFQIFTLWNPTEEGRREAAFPGQVLNDQNRFGISNFGHCDLFDIWDL